MGVAIDGPLWADFWLAEVSGMLAMRDGWTYGAWFRCLILTSRLTAYDSYFRERCPIKNTIVDDLPSALLRSVGTNSFERKVQVCQNTHV